MHELKFIWCQYFQIQKIKLNFLAVKILKATCYFDPFFLTIIFLIFLNLRLVIDLFHSLGSSSPVQKFALISVNSFFLSKNKSKNYKM